MNIKQNKNNKPIEFIVEYSKNKPRELERLFALRDLNVAMLQVLDHYIIKAAKRGKRYKKTQSI